LEFGAKYVCFATTSKFRDSVVFPNWHEMNRKRSSVVFALVLIGIAVRLSSLAGVTVVENVLPGAMSWSGSPILQTVTNPAIQTAVGESFNAVGGCTNYCETFTITGTNYSLQAISLYAGYGTGTGTGTNITLRLFDLGNQTAPNPSPYSPGTDLFNSGNGLAISYSPQTVGVLQFNFTGSDQVALTNGHMYAFEMDGVLNSSPLVWERTTNDSYTAGAAYRNRSWINGNNARDFALAVYVTGISNSPPVVEQRDLAGGNLIQFNDNGAWCWFQSERAVVDTNASKIVIGSDASMTGTGGAPREGNVEATIFDLQSRTSQLYTLKFGASDPAAFYADDHNAPGLLVMSNGNYLAVYAGHNTEEYSYWRIFDGTNWSPEQIYDWSTQPGGDDFNTTYSNPHYMAAEGRIYNFSRGSAHGSPNLITSDDLGQTWTYRGILATNGNVGYVNGYFNYCGNGVDRIDFICTEYHPADYNTSIYHGYVSNAMSFKSDGTLVDSVLYDKLAPTSPDFTRVFAANTIMPAGQTNTRCWGIDVKRYGDGTVAALFSARVNDNTTNPDHAFFYARWNGVAWTSTYLCDAGTMLYSSQTDYTGLGALCPNDPNTIFISTPTDPRNQTNLTVHEIFKGVTIDHGATWSWTPITQQSVRDNLRPIVPVWDGSDTALLWWRGTYNADNAAQNRDTAVVGIIERRSEVVGQMTYVDATATNTFFAATGTPLVTGSGSGQWHDRTGFGNGGSVLASADVTAENAPALATAVTVPGLGTYDLWVNFWASPAATADWRIMAGLFTNQMMLFRQMACKEVQSGDHTTALVLTNTDVNAYLYQGYVGRVTVTTNTAINIFINGNAIQTGTTNTLVGDSCRTWYDGISYAKVDPFQIQTAYRTGPTSVAIAWNSPRPSATLTTPSYALQKKNALTDANWITVTTGIPSGGYSTTNIDNSATGNAAFYRILWP
jgi:hypothetical protein